MQSGRPYLTKQTVDRVASEGKGIKRENVKKTIEGGGEGGEGGEKGSR